ncbi:transient receptor potential cation channel subfamily A member 1 [Amblyraja radiata]|uniref:transient receptor potential cation channel subfamily A member 1 n=1 Tax=Amblyraja radiata TaxID=386614 RepID=UPI0014042610|nr:transient receptor potential cation channel subfamily A member 1 [Amblyraja radiata]
MMENILVRGQKKTCFYSSIQNMDELTSQKNINIFKLVDSGDITLIEKLMEEDHDCLSRMDEDKSSPLHHAAGAGHLNILTLIIEHANFEILNVIDCNGNTPLHWAAEKNQTHIVQTLLDKGANPNILNNIYLSPLHVAMSLNHNGVVKALASHKSTDLNLQGDLKNTPLMLACSRDNSEGLSILLNHGALLCKQNRLGRFPIHEAAFSGANKTMEILIRKGEELGYSREMHTNFLDEGLHTPLHMALLGGKIETIKTCINNGAKIDLQEQKDKSTPLHFACLQGAFEAVRFMLSQYKGENDILHILDGIKQTPIHKAATYDSSELLEYLIEQGSDMNMVDSESRTPLLWATSRCAWNSVKILVIKGANVKIKNSMGCNFLHLTVLQPKGLQNLSEEILKSIEVHELLDDKDNNGCTPLHYVCTLGQTDSVAKMLALKACLYLKTRDKKSSLHFAANYGRLNTCKLLLQDISYTKLLNEGDGTGMTPVLLAAQHGHTAVVQLLLRKGALFMRDYKSWTALHYAALGGHSQTMEVLLQGNISLLDQVDEKGNTALHLAAKRGHNSAVRLLLAQGAAIVLNKNEASFLHEAIYNKRTDTTLIVVQNERFDESVQAFIHGSAMQCPLLEMIEHLPESFAGLLDICMTESSEDKKSTDFSIEYNFKYLQCPLKYKKLVNEDKQIVYTPLAALNAMIHFNQVELLNHPVCKEFLKMKWRAYGLRAHVFNMALFSLLLLPITYIVITSRPFAFINETQNALNATEGLVVLEKKNQGISFHTICTIIIFAMCILGICKEAFQIVQQRWQYFHDSSNLLDGTMYVASILFVIPWVFDVSHPLQWQCGMISAYTSWVNFLLYLQRFDICGIYVVMFAEILKTLLHIMSIFVFLIFAFGLAFYILLYEQKAFRNPFLSLMRILAMMLGDINYNDNFLVPFYENKMPFPLLTFTMLTSFMLFIPILLMNLLIGLAVGDIAEVQRTASLKRMAMQIYLHTSLEEKLPYWFLNKVDETKTTVYPNKRKSGMINAMLHSFTETQNSETHCEMNNQATDLKKLELQMEKQKYRLKDISAGMQKQHELLMLIIRKLGIPSEGEDHDQDEHSSYVKAKRQQFKKARSKWDLALKSMQCRQKQISPCSFTHSNEPDNNSTL